MNWRTTHRPCPTCDAPIEFEPVNVRPGVTAWLVVHPEPGCEAWLTFYREPRDRVQHAPWVSVLIESIKDEQRAELGGSGGGFS